MPSLVYFAEIYQESLTSLVLFLALVSLTGWGLVLLTLVMRLVAHFHYRPRVPLSELPPKSSTMQRILDVFGYAARQKAPPVAEVAKHND